MRFSTFPYRLSIFASAASATAHSNLPNENLQTTSDLLSADGINFLKARAIVQQAEAEPAARKDSTVTTIWMQTTIGSTATYVPVIFPQASATIPDQRPFSHTEGIDENTLHEEMKRAAEAEAPPTPTPTAPAVASDKPPRSRKKKKKKKKKNKTPSDQTFEHDLWRQQQSVPSADLPNILTASCPLTASSPTSSTPSTSTSTSTLSTQSATSFAIELQTLIHTIGVQPVLEVTELTEITTQQQQQQQEEEEDKIPTANEENTKPLSITATHNVNDNSTSRPTFPPEMDPERLRTLLAGGEGSEEGVLSDRK
ncbi:hypothetical protein CERZMDRAFT_81307 [Cercospora zeae-maydis SCOH1-5]|uniref:Uncharacterized protein n=1 Tax=Cercospora zeae-maydis SCOH1-5 TaxID=717836 RepID=A0A6A6FRS2_9PEZI|nr:hypothetical protein CERZMDRAFT_81307 [Cercospora zeae-maydis SCOH1-5]